MRRKTAFAPLPDCLVMAGDAVRRWKVEKSDVGGVPLRSYRRWSLRWSLPDVPDDMMWDDARDFTDMMAS